MAKARKIITGFCNVGYHEGMNARSTAGNPVKVCELWQECSCDCHARFNKLHEMTDTPRVPHPNPEWVRPKSPYVMPDPVEVRAMRLESSRAMSAPVSSVATAPTARHFGPTPTGKRARGELENEVLAICQAFVGGDVPLEELTTKAIALEIDKFDPPSVGAIAAVLDRWTAIGFAKSEKGPVRFVSFTVAGIEHGLEYMKAKHKRDKKMRIIQSGRTLRPRK